MLFLIGLISISATGCTGFRAARLYQEGTRALNTGDSELAVERLSRAARLRPEASEIQNHLGLAFASTGQHGKALSAFQRAVDLDCTNAAAAQNLAAANAAAESGGKMAKNTPSGEASDE